MLDGIKAMKTMLAAGEDPTRTALAMQSQLSTLILGAKNGNRQTNSPSSSASTLPTLNCSPSKAHPSLCLPSRQANAILTAMGGASEENMPPIEGNGHAKAAAAFRYRQATTELSRQGLSVYQRVLTFERRPSEHWTARKRT